MSVKQIANRREPLYVNELPPEIPDTSGFVTKDTKATASKLGLVKIGSGINVTSGGVISVDAAGGTNVVTSLPAASADNVGELYLNTTDRSVYMSTQGPLTLAGVTWVPVNPPDYSGGTGVKEFEVNCTDPNGSITKIKIDYTEQKFYVYTNAYWEQQTLLTLSFIDGTDIENADLIAFVQLNAVSLTPPVSEYRMEKLN